MQTLGSLLVVLSFGILVAKMVRDKNTSSISVKMLQCYSLVFAARLCSILFYEGYLPYDRSGDWFYQTCEVLSLIMVLGMLVAATFVYPRHQKDAVADGFGGWYIPSALGALWLIVPSLLIALIFHPSLNGNFFTDSAWAFAVYLEAVAIFPQLTMFQRSRDKEVEMFTGNFVFGVALARLLHFVFWLSSYHELNNKYAETFHQKYPGMMVVIGQVRTPTHTRARALTIPIYVACRCGVARMCFN